MNLDLNDMLLLNIHQEPHLKGVKTYGVIAVSNGMVSVLNPVKLNSFVHKLFQYYPHNPIISFSEIGLQI
jgi:hypothetical protein